MSEAEWKALVRTIDDQVARLPVLLPQTLLATAAKLVSIAPV